MRTVRRCLATWAMAFALAQPASAQSGGWDSAGTATTGLLVGAALGVPAARGDWNGDVQGAESIGVAFGSAEILKRVFPDRRPDGSDRRSFPSGHASTAFAAAATIQNRWGWRLGLPAQALAAFVAVSRVEARKHAWDDVLVGAAIGEVAGFALTGRRNRAVRIMPWGGARGGGIGLSAGF